MRAKSSIFIAVAGLILSGSRGITRADERGNVSTIKWSKSFVAAERDARAQGKVVMVDFFTQSCRWCKRLDADIFPNSIIAEAAKPFISVKIDAEGDEGKILVEKYANFIKGYPAILFLDCSTAKPSGNDVVAVIPGYMPLHSFAERMQAIKELPKDLSVLRQNSKDRPDDVEMTRQIVAALAMRGDVEEAASLANRVEAAGQTGDKWAAAYSMMGDWYYFKGKYQQAMESYQKSVRLAKSPLELFNGKFGVAMTLPYLGKLKETPGAWEDAAKVPELSSEERKIAEEMLQVFKRNTTGSDSEKKGQTPEGK